jgi:hypothetical protein
MTQRLSPVLTLLLGLFGFSLFGCSSAPSSISQPTVSPAPPSVEAEPKAVKTEAEKLNPVAKAEPTPESKPSAQPVASPKPAPQPDVPQDKIISSVKADWNGDGFVDQAILVAGEPTETTLMVYFSGTTQPITKQNVAWRGEMYGTQPSLSVNPQGSLVITSANDAIGRDRWSRKLTALYEKGGFVVAGYTYSYRDTLDPMNAGTCDVNLLTGKGIKNDKEFRTTLKPMPLAEWTENSEPKECQNS